MGAESVRRVRGKGTVGVAVEVPRVDLDDRRDSTWFEVSISISIDTDLLESRVG